MPERIGWSEHEAALLLWILQDVLNGKMNRQDAIREASKMLRTMALNQGKTIDNAYRNEAGITFQLYGLEGVWLNGKTPIGRKTTWMTNICDVYRRNHQRFDRLVQEAKEMCNASSEDSNFWKWLSIRNSDEQLLRLRAGYHDLNTYGCNLGKTFLRKTGEDGTEKYKQYFSGFQNIQTEKYRIWLNLTKIRESFSNDEKDERIIFWDKYVEYGEFIINKYSQSVTIAFPRYCVVEFMQKTMGPIYIYKKDYYKASIGPLVVTKSNQQLRQLLYGEKPYMKRITHQGNWQSEVQSIISNYEMLYD